MPHRAHPPPPPEPAPSARGRQLHDKVTVQRLRATSAVIHFCQKKTGREKGAGEEREGLRRDSNRQRLAMAMGEGG